MPAGRGRVTIYDVAAEAGVSPSTVSRTFARPGRVGEATAERVRAAADRVGFRAEVTRPGAPGTIGTSGPPPGAPTLIGLVVTDVTNPFYYGIVKGAERAAARLGAQLVLVDAQESEGVERGMLRTAAPHLDGLVLSAPRATDAQLRRLAREHPVVVLNRAVAGLASVVSDDRHGIDLVLDHLTGLGHREVTYVAGPAELWPDPIRWRNLRTAARARGVSAHRIGPFDPTLRHGARIAETLIEANVRAAVFFTDQMALGTMKALQARGVRVPDDLSVVSHGNTYGCALVTPGLTSVALPLTTMGEVGLTNVVGLGQGGAWRGTEPIVLPVSLTVRGSTGPPRGPRVLGRG